MGQGIAEEDAVTLYVRISRSLDEALTTWAADVNGKLSSATVGFQPKMEKSDAVRVLLQRGIEAMRADHAEATAAAAEAARAAARERREIRSQAAIKAAAATAARKPARRRR